MLIIKKCILGNWYIVGQLGLTEPSYYYYLNQSGTYSVDGTNDGKEYEETRVST